MDKFHCQVRVSISFGRRPNHVHLLRIGQISGIQKALSHLVMPDTDSSSEESSTGMNSRFNNMAMPDTDSELSEEETPHAPIAPSRPNHQLNTLVMPDTDSNSSDNGKDASDHRR